MQETEKDYICSLTKDSGMHVCSSLPNMKYEGHVCNDSAVAGVSRHLTSAFFDNGSCVNWNQYYTHCRAGEKNPFQGAISFDNIGLAWVAIFLVRHPTLRPQQASFIPFRFFTFVFFFNYL